MKEYRLYRTDGEREPIGTTPHPGTSYGPFPVDVTDGVSGTLKFVLTAVDTADNESVDSKAALYPYHVVTTNPTGLQVVVDEMAYTGPNTFTWEAGSSHKLSVTSPQSGGQGIQCIFTSWSDEKPKTHTITAPHTGKTYTAKFTIKYSLTTSVNLFEGGKVSPAGTSWFKSGANVSVKATPHFGYRFIGWSGDYSGPNKSITLDMNGPKNLVANFEAIPEEVSVPTTPKGVSKGDMDTNYIFSTSSSSNLLHSLEYQYDWGDGSTSIWGLAKQSHVWTTAGIYQVRVMARCATHTSIVSGWSNIKSVTINGWLYTISGENEEKGGATLWFDQGSFDGYGVSYQFETFRIQGSYSEDAKGVMSGTFTLEGAELVSGTLTGSVNSDNTKMKLVLKDSNDLPVFNMAGVRLRGEPDILGDWSATISGDATGSVDPLTIESFQDGGEVFSHVFLVSGSGTIGTGSVSIQGNFFFTPTTKTDSYGNVIGNIVYGVYEMTGGITDTGVISGTLNPKKGKFTFNLTSDNGMDKYKLVGKN
jgi:hypothetical protein